ncbi:hypothetical protein [Streptomyces sp. NPDC057702]|uniref:hypothetical protein n=1 Tax=unclassified Streptomyces TaxID=2593676 RepID=UPI0036A2A884
MPRRLGQSARPITGTGDGTGRGRGARPKATAGRGGVGGRRIAAVALALAALGAGLAGTSVPATAAGRAGEAPEMPSTTLPGARMALPRAAGALTADGTGFLSSARPNSASERVTWVRDGGGTVEDLPSAAAYNGGYGLERVADGQDRRIRHYASGDVVTVDVPDTDTATEVFARNRLVTLREEAGRNTLRLLEVPTGGGRVVDRPVTGLPDDMGPFLYTTASDDQGAAFWYKPVGGGAYRTGLLDFASARVTLLPAGDLGLLEYPRLTPDKVVFLALTRKFDVAGAYVVDRRQPTRPGTLISTLDGATGFHTETGAAGDWLVYVSPTDTGRPVRAVPLAGGPARTLLPRSRGPIVSAADGSLLVEGGADARDWALRRITAGTDGAPSVAVRTALPPLSAWEVGGLAVDQGRVLVAGEDPRATDAYAGTSLFASTLSLAPDGKLTASPPRDEGDLGYWVPGDDSGDPGSSGYHQVCYGDCLRLTGTGQGAAAHEGYGTRAVVAAFGTYQVVRPHATRQEVRAGTTVLASSAPRPAALWGSTLWTPATTRGAVTSTALPSLKVTGTQPVGATCAPADLADLQVVGRWIYWSCGPGRDAGVYDQSTRRTTRVPTGYAQLADGYLVSQDDATRTLRITYLPEAVPADQVGTHELADLPAPLHAPQDRRGRFWAVDRFSGALAYLDAHGDVAIRWPQVRTSPLAVITRSTPGVLDARAGNLWKASWHLSRPVAQWKLTVRRTPGGAVVREFTGTDARGPLGVRWDGTSGGGKVPTGAYRWTLTAREADGTRQPMSVSGTVAVRTR